MKHPHQNNLTAGYERKLLTGMLFVMVAFLPTLGFAMYCLSTVSKTENQLNSIYTRTLLLAEDLRTAKAQQDAIMPAFVLSGDTAILGELTKSDESFEKTLTSLQAMPLAPAAEIALMDIQNLQQQLLAVEKPGVEMRKTGVSTTDVDNYFRQNAFPLIKPILKDLDQFVQVTSDRYDQEKHRSNRSLRAVFRVLVIASSISVVFSAGIIILLLRLVHRKKVYDALNERLALREKEISTARKETLETVAHDLKNPLSAIMMTVELLQRRADLSAHHQTKVGTILASANSMNSLITNLLDHTKIETGTLTLARKAGDIEALITRLTARFEVLAQAKGIEIKDARSAGSQPVSIDEMRVEQVFSNLLGNAVKFMDNGGTIRIADFVENDMLTISISDNGPGMTAEQTEHVFERYWQADETAAKGTGLGLAISKAIVDGHEGRISVQSEPGVGSTFYVALPLAVNEAVCAA